VGFSPEVTVGFANDALHPHLSAFPYRDRILWNSSFTSWAPQGKPQRRVASSNPSRSDSHWFFFPSGAQSPLQLPSHRRQPNAHRRLLPKPAPLPAPAKIDIPSRYPEITFARFDEITRCGTHSRPATRSAPAASRINSSPIRPPRRQPVLPILFRTVRRLMPEALLARDRFPPVAQSLPEGSVPYHEFSIPGCKTPGAALQNATIDSARPRALPSPGSPPQTTPVQLRL